MDRTKLPDLPDMEAAGMGLTEVLAFLERDDELARSADRLVGRLELARSRFPWI
jgi:hypothetical protein